MLPDRLTFSPNVRLIGTPRIETGTRVTSRFRSGRVPALLAYLGLRPGAAVHREEIAEALWPSLAPGAARNNLRVTLRYLRQALDEHGLGRALVAPDRSLLTLEPEVARIDVVRYWGLVDAARREGGEALAEALGLAGAPLMRGFDDAWIDPYREAYDASRSELRGREAAALLLSDPRRALEIGRRLASEEPLDGDAHGLVAQAHLRLGDPVAAIGELRAYRDRLERETEEPLPTPLAELLARAEESLILPKPARAIPVSRTRFYGREAELAAIVEWAEARQDRLLTVHGPGGIGKSRLGAEALARLPRATGAVWIDATNVLSGEALLDLVAASVGSGVAVPGRSLDRIVALLDGQESLLVLDNLEGLPDDDAPVVDAVLDALPGLQALCLSRKTLGLPGERILRLDPLRVPDSAEDLIAPSVRLFLDRATGLDAPREAGIDDDLLALSRDLEGIPLAIELAAAKTTTLSVRELREGMNARLDVLVGRSAKHSRHRTMRSTLDWSFDLLDPEMRESIVGLAVLRNGWTLEAADALADARDLPATREVLEVGCTNSLLVRERSRGESRYRMLECTREYALETLAPSRHAVLRARHAAYFRGLAGRRLGLAELEQDEPNLQAALEHLAESPDRIDDLFALGDDLRAFWTETSAGRAALRVIESIDRAPLSPISQGRLELLETTLRISISDFGGGLAAIDRGLAVECDAKERASLLAARSHLCRVLGRRDEAEAAADGAVAVATGLSDESMAEALYAQSTVGHDRLDPDSFRLSLRAVEHAERGANVALLARLLDGLSLHHFRRGEVDLAEAVLARSDALPLTPTAVRQARRWLARAQIAIMRGDLLTAREAFRNSLGAARVSAHPWHLCQALAQLGDAETMLGNFAEARAAHEEARTIRLRTGERAGLASCLRGLGMASDGLGEHERAFAEMSEARRIAEASGDDFFLLTLLMPLARAARAAGRESEAREAAQAVAGSAARLPDRSELVGEIDVDATLAEARAFLEGP